ncbi:hypothetical protein EMPS_05775 [Entomortierella parvispora]|uniref:SUN domain-containing protein n=1 Tax=Entomortierella parvispora TaxID=205924 RepID=A0A9P3LWT4_9FUNG|nr:hypothetical protein EMPS_05775 [Entomortierella parvispora]
MPTHSKTKVKVAGQDNAINFIASVMTADEYDDTATGNINKPASSPSLVGSTVVVSMAPSETVNMVAPEQTHTTVTVVAESSMEVHPNTAHSYPDDSSTGPTFVAVAGASPTVHTTNGGAGAARSASSDPSPAASTASTTIVHTERHIPSYEQWRKQVLDKKDSDTNERKQRRRKPYQESAVDVAIGGEDELGFVFPNLDNGGNGKGGEDRFQHLAGKLGNGPDVKKTASPDTQWIKSEYAKDSKDRFNHASATCAASVVRASKDATHITAILNEGKDNYMLNKCSTKDKFFVVELCEEILVDTFILGNYEFFSSTFKDFVVSVNRYPPREDGWSILGHFQARNTRDAQVFKPAVPQLATYIRFDFVNHYGREYYCPVTLLRVYGATALEQLKQEEEEEKRLAERAAREKAVQAANDAEDDEEDAAAAATATELADEIAKREKATKESVPAVSDVIDIVHEDSQDSVAKIPEHQHDGDILQPVTQGEQESTFHTGEEEVTVSPPDQQPEAHEHTETATFLLPEWPHEEVEEDHFKDLPWVDSPQEQPAQETITQLSETIPTNALPIPASTSPASLQDDNDWKSGDLGMITFSQKNRPTAAPKPPPSKASSAGLGTTSGASSAGDGHSAHPVPSPAHSSQESVYKNIVNRLKVLELNSSLSYQYLEEQSNVFNEVIESSEQKINQLVYHLNEANRRLEVLGRKYDQLAYSYRGHVEIDGERKRQDFINLSSQVHLLGSQILFQRHLIVVGAITIFSILAYLAITGSSSMHYAIQHSPLGAKLRAIAGQRARQDSIRPSVRIGSVEALSMFDERSLQQQQQQQQQHSDNSVHSIRLVEDSKMSPPLSPMSPLTPDTNQSHSRMLDSHDQSVDASPQPNSNTSMHREDSMERSPGDVERNNSPSNLSPLLDRLDSSDSQLFYNPPQDRFHITRTPYPTPKHSFGPGGRLFLDPSNSSSNIQNHQQQQPHYNQHYPSDYRPDSPVFQSSSSMQDDGQLSDADVAYISRDMNMGRRFSGSMPTTPAMKRLSVGYYGHYHSPQGRPSSSLRMDTTASLAAIGRSESDSPEDAQQQPQPPQQEQGLESSGHVLHESPKDLDNGTHSISSVLDNSLLRTPEMRYNGSGDDVGFVSDSVLDSASESMGSREILKQSHSSIGEWDQKHGLGESALKADDRDGSREAATGLSTPPPVPSSDQNDPREATTEEILDHQMPQQQQQQGPRLTKEPSSSSSKSMRRRSSHSIHRSQESATAGLYKNHSASAALGLGIGLGSNADASAVQDSSIPHVEENGLTSGTASQNSSSGPNLHRKPTSGSLHFEYEEDEVDDGACADDDSAVVPGSSKSERRKRSLGRKSIQLPDTFSSEDQAVPAPVPIGRRRSSYGRRGSVGELLADESTASSRRKEEEDEKDVEKEEELGRDGDDERSPQVSRRTLH